MNNNILKNIEIPNNRPLGRFGRMALEYLKATHPLRYQTLLMQGKLMTVMHEVQERATDKILEMMDDLLKRNPIPDTEDILVKTRHINKYKLIAEEFVVEEIIKIPR